MKGAVVLLEGFFARAGESLFSSTGEELGETAIECDFLERRRGRVLCVRFLQKFYDVRFYLLVNRHTSAGLWSVALFCESSAVRLRTIFGLGDEYG